MGKPPAVIIIARHGARLDAANKQWHLTSPTPYDPPLTYGGWTQSQALGARIASLLQAREESGHEPHKPNAQRPSSSDRLREAEPEGSGPASKHRRHRRRKHKVIIHSSPFLRCVQTAIAVSAGINQSQWVANTPQTSTSKPHRFYSGSPHIKATDSADSPRLSAIPEPGEGTSQPFQGHNQTTTGGVPKCSVRIDAFLGEWLSPDYFEQITPPPGSVTMVAGAKAELLRRGVAIEAGAEDMAPGHFPGGWRSSSIAGNFAVAEEDTSFKDMTNLSKALPGRNRAGSYDSMASARGRSPGSNPTKISTDVSTDRVGYVPPTPTYAISPSDPIPAGYVSHARDACVDVDYQWDSMRKPQDWGNGGEYGEEWSSMHLRFRNGLQQMINWYKSHDVPPTHETMAESPFTEDEDDFTDTVLVLITHGAGCNALIGALTSQPVLLDVGMASLTMAVRKDILGNAEGKSNEGQPSAQGPPQRSRSSSDLTVSEEYDVKLLVSTDHLRPGFHPLHMSQSPSPKTGTPAPKPSYRQRFGSGSSSPRGSFSIGDPGSRQPGVHRASSTSSRVLYPGRSASGLWGAVPAGDGASESGDDIVPNFGDPAPPSSGASTPSEDAARIAGRSQRGLWGSTSSPRERDADGTPKRRWTVNERHI